MSGESGIDFTKVFQQYQTTAMIPELEYRIADGKASYRWTNVVQGFDMPVEVALSDRPSAWVRIRPTTAWTTMPVNAGTTELIVKRDYYVTSKRASLP